jgi:uncharacterized membrane protein YccF (DUF307 family)
MSFLLNILWFIFGGFISGTLWLLFGLLWCITIVGIPIGVQCFKFAKLTYAPFGKDVKYKWTIPSVTMNIIWIILSGVPMAIFNFVLGTVQCITIIGIPLGLQYYKIAKLALAPFGTKVK